MIVCTHGSRPAEIMKMHLRRNSVWLISCVGNSITPDGQRGYFG